MHGAISLTPHICYVMACNTWEVDGAIVVGIYLVDHVLELRLARVLAEGPHDSAQFLGCDLACVQRISSVALDSRSEDGISRVL